MNRDWFPPLAELISNRAEADTAGALAELVGLAVKHEGTCLIAFHAERTPEVLHHTLEPAGASHYLDRYLAGPYLLDPLFRLSQEALKPGVCRYRDATPDRFRSSEYYRQYCEQTHLTDEIDYLVDMNTAIDQQVEKHLRETGAWESAQKKIDSYFEGRERPRYSGDLPEGNDGLGLGLLGISGDKLVDAETYDRIRAATLASVRGTVQADILKEDQAQNTCIFSTEFAMKMMGDVQQFFIDNEVRNYYSVSISGYHIAEAGANPISQLAFTLANGFTIVEYYLARGMDALKAEIGTTFDTVPKAVFAIRILNNPIAG